MIAPRRIRFRLATLLIGVTFVCVVLAIQRWYEFQRSQARQYIEGLGGRVEYGPEFIRRRTEADKRLWIARNFAQSPPLFSESEDPSISWIRR